MKLRSVASSLWQGERRGERSGQHGRTTEAMGALSSGLNRPSHDPSTKSGSRGSTQGRPMGPKSSVPASSSKSSVPASLPPFRRAQELGSTLAAECCIVIRLEIDGRTVAKKKHGRTARIVACFETTPARPNCTKCRLASIWGPAVGARCLTHSPVGLTSVQITNQPKSPANNSLGGRHH